MKRVIYIFVFFATIACQAPKSKTESSVDSSSSSIAAGSYAVNQLTAQQIADGWVLLFDGESMKGWRTYKNKENDSWEVSEGTLHCKPFKEEGDNKRADLITESQYDNFELVFDWKVAPQSNSGVIYRTTEEYDQPYATGPEYQILDDEGYPGDLRDVQLTGANYDMHVASNKTLKPAGEWNQSKIVAQGNRIEHWLNGAKVVAYEIGSEEWNTRRKESKWKDFPAYGTAKKGHIDLQDHGNEVWFRNIMIKPL